VTVRVLLVDDHDLLRAGLATVLGVDPDIEVVGECADGRTAARLAREIEPDVVLMDIEMPECDGITATADIVSTTTATRVLVLTTFDVDDYVLEALRAGASGFSAQNEPAARAHRGRQGLQLYLAETTVKTYVARILHKLGVRDRVQAVVIAHQSGMTRWRHSSSSRRSQRNRY
jgi:DNA-binding NarL/FixJ family response regulator